MTAASMKAKIKAAYQARTGLQLQEGAWNALIDVCTGIVEEIQQNAIVNQGISVTIPVTASPGATSSGSTNGTGTIT